MHRRPSPPMVQGREPAAQRWRQSLATPPAFGRRRSPPLARKITLVARSAAMAPPSAMRSRLTSKSPTDVARRAAARLAEVGEERAGSRQTVYFAGRSHALYSRYTGYRNLSCMASEKAGETLRDALDNPLHGRAGGRHVGREDIVVRKLVVVQVPQAGDELRITGHLV